MRILVLGGTRFVGRHSSSTRRGATRHGLQPRARAAAVGRRRAPRGRPRDGRPGVVARARLGRLPRRQRLSAAACSGLGRAAGDRVARYAYISTASVYASGGGPPIEEASALHEVPEREFDAVEPGLYGPLKVACEQEARARWGARSPPGADPAPGHRGGALRPHQPLRLVGRARLRAAARCSRRARRVRPSRSWTAVTSRGSPSALMAREATGVFNVAGEPSTFGGCCGLPRGHRQRRDADW